MKKGIICLTIVCLLVLSLVLSFVLINGSRHVCYGLNDTPSSLEGGSCSQMGGLYGGYYGGLYGGLYGEPRSSQGLYDL